VLIDLAARKLSRLLRPRYAAPPQRHARSRPSSDAAGRATCSSRNLEFRLGAPPT